MSAQCYCSMFTQFFVHKSACKTILCARKSVHTNIKFVEPYWVSQMPRVLQFRIIKFITKCQNTCYFDKKFQAGSLQLTCNLSVYHKYFWNFVIRLMVPNCKIPYETFFRLINVILKFLQ